jgi:hypothetical protein
MDLERLFVYGLAIVLLLVALWRRSNGVRAGQIKGSIFIGDNSGTLNQSYFEAAGSTRAKDGDVPVTSGDRVAWLIAIIGVLIAATQLTYDVFPNLIHDILPK